jgi:hypothetical protein
VIVSPTPGAERAGDAALATWCSEHLGAVPVARLFEASHLSTVIGVELDDGRLAVVKARPWSDRLLACTSVQRGLFQRGFPCAEVLVGPTPFGDRVATAEAYIPRGSTPPSPPDTGPSARLLASLIERMPPPADHPELSSVLPWVGWDHGDGGVWPPPDDLDVDLNSEVSDTLDVAAVRVTRRLAAAKGEVIGHLDWEARNLEWQDGEPSAVHDWDSLAVRPESTVAGAAAAVHPSHGPVVFASIEQSEAFLSAYIAMRPLSAEEMEEAWAAGAWILAYNAKKERRGGGAGYLERAAHELEERLRRAGA